MESWNQTAEPARTHTPELINRKIDAKVEACVRALAAAERPELARYLGKLEREWDLNRVLLVATSALALGAALVHRTGRGGKALSTGLAVGAAAVLQQGVVGYGPLTSLLRSVGVRTRGEIDLEKFALKALRGDFERIMRDAGPNARANAALVAAQS